MIGLNPFFLEQMSKGKFADVTPAGFDLDHLLEAVRSNWTGGKKGYRDGVVKVQIPHAGWKTTVITLTAGMELVGAYESRIEGETPRKQTRVVVSEFPPAQLVEAVLYRIDVLEEGDEPRSNDAWQIITILTHPTPTPTPMAVGTLMANHFGADGGTRTCMSAEEFEENLRESYDYWKDKGIGEKRASLKSHIDDLRFEIKRLEILSQRSL